MPEMIAHTTEAARMLYMYGDAEGRRVVNLRELAERTGAKLGTLENYAGEWRREYLAMVKDREENRFKLSLSSETLELHSKDVIFLRNEIARLEIRLSELDPESENYKSIHAAYLATRRDWERASGVSGALAAAEARLKESERAKAKAAAAAEASERERENQPRDVSPVSSVFRRRGPDPDGLD